MGVRCVNILGYDVIKAIWRECVLERCKSMVRWEEDKVKGTGTMKESARECREKDKWGKVGKMGGG